MTLREFLARSDTTQAAFAAALGCSQAHVARLCAGQSPSLELAAKIEAATDGAVTLSDWVQQREAAQ